jgi:hypothetical protein
MKLKLKKAEVRHILAHLEQNRIHETVGTEQDWYCGNREQFIDRHKKTVKSLRKVLHDD